MVRINNKEVGTLKEFYDRGYRRVEATSYQKGYVSRKPEFQNPAAIPIYRGRGSRNGQYFYLSPLYNSTRYCLRVYISKC